MNKRNPEKANVDAWVAEEQRKLERLNTTKWYWNEDTGKFDLTEKEFERRKREAEAEEEVENLPPEERNEAYWNQLTRKLERMKRDSDLKDE
jgi:hypothetical protein